MNLSGRDLRLNLNGDDVRLLHAELSQIGFAPPEEERLKAFFGLGTQEIVIQFQKQHQLTTNGVVDAQTAKAINQVVDAGNFTVSGTVTSPDRVGVGGLRVQIVDKNVGGDTILAGAATDERGRYQVRFAATSLRQRGKQQADLQAQVSSGDGNLGASDVRYNATNQETLDVRLSAGATALPSEHETLTAALAPHLRGALGALEESDVRQDITYLANKTGWDARAVALAALADQFSQSGADPTASPAIQPAFYYALFRAGLPANPDTLYNAGSENVGRIWQQAIESGVIARVPQDEITKAVQAFQALSAQKLLTAPAIAGVSSLKEMLNTSRLNDKDQQQFAELYAAQRSDPPSFWKSVGDTLGVDVATRLQVDGKLAFLTINNAPLVQALHAIGGPAGIADPVELAQAGFHRASAWNGVLTDVPIPNEIPGDTAEARRRNYAAYLAAQVRLSYPTAAVADTIKLDLPDVHAFLTGNQGKFEIGVQPVERYIAQNQLSVPATTVVQVKRLQRIYQITPSDLAMTGLMKRGIGSASQVVRFQRETFVATFANDLGGAEAASQTYDKSVEVHHAVLQIALSYLTARNGLPLGATPIKPEDRARSSGLVLDPGPKNPAGDHAADVIAFPTLEGLFTSMDFCECQECRSILSPAAYLVDLLLFIDVDPATAGTNPQTVLFDRRPDIQHLPLTCENTNTALPYIDVVNETLEYYIANGTQKLSLLDYKGHDTGGAPSEDLLATAQSFNDGVRDAAYTILRDEGFPSPLPFHQPLENLRRYFEKFGVRLPLAMERLRKNDKLDVDRKASPPPPVADYGWRDILMEEIGLSRTEHDILTDSKTVPLSRMYGFPDGTGDGDVIAGLSNAKQFTRRMGITYEDIVAVLETRFVNPNGDLIPKLERLRVSFTDLQTLNAINTPAADAAFDALLPKGANAPDSAEFGGDIKTWVKQPDNFERIMGIITLTDPTSRDDPGSFDPLEFRFSKPTINDADTSTRLGTAEFVRLLRFIRLWKATKWTIAQTDAAVCALFPMPPAPRGVEAIDTLAKLDAGFLLLLPRLGIVVRTMRALNLTPQRDLRSVLACWSLLGTYGDAALYRQMFLNPALLKQDAVFDDNGFGEFLQDQAQTLVTHSEALRSAFNLTGEEFDRILAALGFDAASALTLANVSAIYRPGWLARTLRLSVRELLLLTELTGLDPFIMPDPTNPAILRLASVLQALKDTSLNPATALYLMWNQDVSGRSAPDAAQLTAFARALRLGFAAIESELVVKDDPDGAIAQARVTSVYGADATSFFFGLVDDTFSVDADFGDPDNTLTPGPVSLAISNAAGATDGGNPKLAYDDFRKRLSYTGVLEQTVRDAIKSAAGAGAATFNAAVDTLFDRNQTAIVPFFDRYAELQPLYAAYVGSTDPVTTKRSALLGGILPELVKRRKKEQALQTVSAAAQTSLDFARALLDSASNGFALHAVGHTDQPALNDCLALETQGLSVQFFASDTASGTVIPFADIAANLDYSAATGDVGNALPVNSTTGAAVSGVWTGYLEAPESGFFNIRVATDAGASVTLSLDNKMVALTGVEAIFTNTSPIELRAGTLYPVVLTVERVRQAVRVQWEWNPKGQGRGVIPARYLYPASSFNAFRDAYVRFLKASALATALGLTAKEMAHFATQADYRISALGQTDAVGGDGWLNLLPNADNLHLANPTSRSIARALNATLLTPLQALLDYARIKADISPGDEALLTILDDPATATQNGDSLLFTLTRSNANSLDAMLARFGGTIADLKSVGLLVRVYDAFRLVEAMGVSGAALIHATTNEPDGSHVRDLQAALRARYDAADWRDIVQPINDAMRGLQRNALVAYILRHMRESADTVLRVIDTPDRLFEYFLMDVQMEPCMQTSRIRHALSSVQLFIERCLMNLEPRVSSASINGRQWAWMKRYRVWEANRKIFLFPENWLEPELRDDKSPFFKEIESELLHTDITEDSATAALSNYLSKLEEVAKLEPCGIFHIEGDGKRTGDIDHVVARTGGAHRKYYYRRYEGGSWSPWGQIQLDIEDNPVIPVVWKDRLFLFWLLITKQGPLDAGKVTTSNDTTNLLGAMSLNAIQTDATRNAQSNTTVTIQAALCWSEYYNGKWQATKTSDTSRPATLCFRAGGIFDRSTLQLWVLEESDGLRIVVHADVGNVSASFLLHNTHSVPLSEEGVGETDEALARSGRATSVSTNNSLSVVYSNGLEDPAAFWNTVLKSAISGRTVEPWNAPANRRDTPFFYEDTRHAFYVTTTEQSVPILVHLGYHLDAGASGLPTAENIPPLILREVSLKTGPKIWGEGGRVGPAWGLVDPAPIQRLVTEDAYIRQGIGTTGAVAYKGRQIGPSGALRDARSEQ